MIRISLAAALLATTCVLSTGLSASAAVPATSQADASADAAFRAIYTAEWADPQAITVRGGRAALDVTIPRQGVALVVVDGPSR